MEFVTPRNYPFDPQTGKFQSEPAEAAYRVAAEYGLSRHQFRRVLQAFAHANDKCNAGYAQSSTQTAT